MVKIYNKADKAGYAQERILNNDSRLVQLFLGDMRENARMGAPDVWQGFDAIVKMKNAKWEGTAEFYALWNKIKEYREKVINQNSVPSNLATLIQAYFVDITRRVMEIPDYTNKINTETTNFDFPESVTLREIYKYRAKFDHYNLNNDSVNLIEQYSGAIDTVIMDAQAVGWKDTLKNLLYNPLFDMQKVLQAVAEAFVDERNDKALGYIFGTVFHPSQIISLVTMPGTTLTYDEQLYMQYRGAYELIRTLLDPQNNRPIAIPSLALICHSARVWESQRVIEGMLERTGASTGRGNLTSPLPIGEIWAFDGDAYTWGKQAVNYAGCGINDAYLLVPRTYSYTLVKRPLTMEIGRGSVLQLSTEERAWYFIQAEYYRDLLGSSFPGSSLLGGYGAIVKIALPTFNIET